MFLRLFLKFLVVIAVGLIQSTGVYTIQPPQILAAFGHFIFPASLFFLFSPEVIEVSDFKKVIGDLPFRILTLVTTALSLLPVVFIRKFIFLEYNHLDSIPLKLGFTLFRTYSTEEKLDYLNNLLLNIGGSGLFTDSQKILLATQSTGIKDLQNNLTQLILLQQQEILSKNKGTGWGEAISFFMSNHQYLYTAAIAVGSILTAYFLYSNQETLFRLYNNVKKVIASNDQTAATLETTGVIVTQDHQTITSLVNSYRKLSALVSTHQDLFEKTLYLTSITQEDIVGLKRLLENICRGKLQFCECAKKAAEAAANAAEGRRLGNIASLAKGSPITTTTTTITDSIPD